MNIFLVRHGHSENDRPDYERILSPKGIQEVESLARKLKARSDVLPQKIFHSGLYRARDTANILNDELQLNLTLNISENLSPTSPVQYWEDQFLAEEDNLMLVGHMPFMGILTEVLVGSEHLKEGIQTASLVWIRKTPSNQYEFVAYINSI